MVSRSTPRIVVWTAKVKMAPIARKKRLTPVAMTASFVGIGNRFMPGSFPAA